MNSFLLFALLCCCCDGVKVSCNLPVYFWVWIVKSTNLHQHIWSNNNILDLSKYVTVLLFFLPDDITFIVLMGKKWIIWNYEVELVIVGRWWYFWVWGFFFLFFPQSYHAFFDSSNLLLLQPMHNNFALTL